MCTQSDVTDRQSQLRFHDKVVIENVAVGIMGATMNLLSTLAFIAIGLFLPAFGISVPTTTAPDYIDFEDTRPLFILDTKAYGVPPTKLVLIRYDPKIEGGLSYWHEQPDQLQEYLKSRRISSYNYIGFDKLPKRMATLIVHDYRELYSEALPYLLKMVPLDYVAKRLPKKLLETLKPDDKKKISAEDLAKFKKLYD